METKLKKDKDYSNYVFRLWTRKKGKSFIRSYQAIVKNSKNIIFESMMILN